MKSNIIWLIFFYTEVSSILPVAWLSTQNSAAHVYGSHIGMSSSALANLDDLEKNDTQRHRRTYEFTLVINLRMTQKTRETRYVPLTRLWTTAGTVCFGDFFFAEPRSCIVDTFSWTFPDRVTFPGTVLKQRTLLMDDAFISENLSQLVPSVS